MAKLVAATAEDSIYGLYLADTWVSGGNRLRACHTAGWRANLPYAHIFYFLIVPLSL
jgi:hypothetical protein